MRSICILLCTPLRWQTGLKAIPPQGPTDDFNRMKVKVMECTFHNKKSAACLTPIWLVSYKSLGRALHQTRTLWRIVVPKMTGQLKRTGLFLSRRSFSAANNSVTEMGILLHHPSALLDRNAGQYMANSPLSNSVRCLSLCIHSPTRHWTT
ncbi:hypothetical protein RSOLAG1IB_08327 [Rhizoctonia solani AG-1 IB]|uniref:Uncharacterized protein n=1 Tax=Thanatephorus cucumeris (strain AG1-IB / isolate 7/3/14) TaxID=1108050 RepID=A0A0B7FLL1_THACB|nr:hypothetical protein RSOLAG1IB_08327 [Rhizoctonia solani AG-1 IB]